MLDYIIKNGKVIDGTGAPAFFAEVGIKDGKIVLLCEHINEEADVCIDAKGEYITPGFIDIHRHADARVFSEDFGELELRQGITTIVNGNCGLSIIPCTKKHREEIFEFLKPIVGEVGPQIFDDYSSYIKALEKCPLLINVGMLLGNGTVRACVKGYEAGKLSKEELEEVQKLIRTSLEAGALGVSLGIVYAPEYNYNLEDFAEVLKPMQDFSVPLVTHIRGEGDIFKESVEEVIEIAKRLGVPLHISHLKCIGKRNWGHGVAEVLYLMDKARLEGMDVTCDVYPYTAGSTQLIQILPPQYLEGGITEIVKRLKDTKQRKKLTEILRKPSNSFENLVSSIGFENIRVTSVVTEKNKLYIGKSITEIAAILGKDEYDCAYDLLIEENCCIAMVDFITSEEDIQTILKYPYTNVISDTVYPEGGIPHPRMYGTFPRVLEKYVKKEKVLPLEEAVRKMTSLPAMVYKIKNKGTIAVGMDADLLIFDLEKVHTSADYDNPRQMAEGFTYIFVNGVLALHKNRCLFQKIGKVI